MQKYHKKIPTSRICPNRLVPLIISVLVVTGASMMLGVGRAEQASMFTGGQQSELTPIDGGTGAGRTTGSGTNRSGPSKPSSQVQSNKVVAKKSSPTPNPASAPAPQPAPAPASAPTPSASKFSTSPTWNQNFISMAAGQPNTSIWRYDLNPEVPGWNGEAQGYTNSLNNVRIEAGKGLVIEARKENYSYPGDARVFGYTSGRIDTKNSFSFEYGKIEAVMKLPKGAGTWPAFWMLSANNPWTSKLNPTEADWAKPRFYAKDGELDIMEHYGNLPGLVEGTMHSYVASKGGNTQVNDYGDVYHTYGVELSPSGITWTVDGKAFRTETKTSDDTDVWPFGNGNKLYVILNLAMGGSGGGAINDAATPWRLEIQRVSYYPYIGG